MSWFFGKKKHHQRESPPDTPEENRPAQVDDYVIIEKQINPLSPTAGGLYPHLGDSTAFPPSYPPATSQNQLLPGDSQNYLREIPFKLSKSLNNDFEIDRIRVDEIMSFVIRIKNEDYNYDFGLETSVINEMESRGY